MAILEAIFLGLVQGLTEFLPISSTGHLILVRDLFNITAENNLAFDAVLHLATVVAVGLYFRHEVWQLIRTTVRFVTRQAVTDSERVFLFAVVIGTIPAMILGLLFESTIENTFRSSLIVACGLLAGTVVMYFADRFAKQNAVITPKKGLLIGCFQALALIPGMSRSGLTISGGLMNGLTRDEATRFAFVLSFPILLGAGILSLYRLLGTNIAGEGSALFFGCIAAFVAGFFAIDFLVKYLKNHTFKVFLWYRVILALIIVLVYAF